MSIKAEASTVLYLRESGLDRLRRYALRHPHHLVERDLELLHEVDRIRRRGGCDGTGTGSGPEVDVAAELVAELGVLLCICDEEHPRCGDLIRGSEVSPPERRGHSKEVEECVDDTGRTRTGDALLGCEHVDELVTEGPGHRRDSDGHWGFQRKWRLHGALLLFLTPDVLVENDAVGDHELDRVLGTKERAGLAGLIGTSSHPHRLWSKRSAIRLVCNGELLERRFRSSDARRKRKHFVLEAHRQGEDMQKRIEDASCALLIDMLFPRDVFDDRGTDFGLYVRNCENDRSWGC